MITEGCGPSTAQHDREYYDSETTTEEELRKWLAEIQPYFKKTKQELKKRYGVNGCKALEMGAGSCWLSLYLSSEQFVKGIVCLDISLKRMAQRHLLTHAIIGGDKSKLSFCEADFNIVLPFRDEEFDVVLFDAALHHSRCIWETLKESKRVLKRGGTLIAQREAYLSPLRSKRQLRRILETIEVKSSVSENQYLKEQYDFLLRASGFQVEFLPIFSNWKKRLLFFANGILYSDWIIVASKPIGDK